MSDTYRATIPYESMDPLAIGATDDESKKHRDTLELDIPAANLVAAVYPDEPEPVADPTEAARRALAEPVDGPTFAELLADPAIVHAEPQIKATSPIGRVGASGELKGVAVFLASDAASYITGQTIVVDGGRTIAS